MRGFGEPSEQVEMRVFGDRITSRPYPWGFGDPSEGADYQAQPDAGFGDILPDVVLGVLLISGRDLPDDGGILLKVAGDYPSLGFRRGLEAAGPFQVQLKDVHSGDRYPKDMTGCHSGIVGKGNECFTDVHHKRLSFVLPPLPLSEFSIEIRHGDFLENLIVIPSAFRVVHRTREAETYGGRSHISAILNPGARFPDLEKSRGE